MTPEIIRKNLKYTWLPLFKRYGSLTLPQHAAIPEILSGRDILLIAPTASGKTEAVLAPTLELQKRSGVSQGMTLYIAPTRALVTDLFARLQGPAQELGFIAEYKHGDKPYLTKKGPPNLLITTPESLDSLICRKPELFKHLHTLILDEVHLLDGTARGDQIRVLIQRLVTIQEGRRFSIHLLSATVADPAALAARYVQNCKVVQIGSPRQIDARIMQSVEEINQHIREKRYRKVLFFCNRRESVEKLGRELKTIFPQYPVLAHHGSLSKKERDDSESTLKQAQVAFCAATSTLEIGIDIGDIDLVVLYEIPWSISALSQRIGRGKRRGNVINVVCRADTFAEKEIIEAMLAAAELGMMEQKDYEPDNSVIVQQILSCCYAQRAGLHRNVLRQYLLPVYHQKMIDLVIDKLLVDDLITCRREVLYASTTVMELGDKGILHSNIEDTKKYKVMDVTCGQLIGDIWGPFNKTFVLSHRAWQIVKTGYGVLYVQPFKGQATPALFARHSEVGAFHYLLPEELK